ncbi:MAG: hypothetical protein WCV55_03150 [Candidatus Paceibacterota bacterium]
METYYDWYYSGEIHPVVQDFVIDVLASRILPVRLLKSGSSTPTHYHHE